MTSRIFSLHSRTDFVPVTLSGHRNSLVGCYFEENSLAVSLKSLISCYFIFKCFHWKSAALNIIFLLFILVNLSFRLLTIGWSPIYMNKTITSAKCRGSNYTLIWEQVYVLQGSIIYRGYLIIITIYLILLKLILTNNVVVSKLLFAKKYWYQLLLTL